MSNNHPNRNWRKRWQVSGQCATHTSGLRLMGEYLDGRINIMACYQLPLSPDTYARLAQSRQFARCCEEGLRLLLETLPPCQPR